VSKLEPYIPSEFPPENLELKPFISKISTANREIARFDGILHWLPNPDILLAPLTTREAVLSSRIEGTQATFNLYTQMKEKFIQATRSQYAIPALVPFLDNLF
jgi:Fic family protein